MPNLFRDRKSLMPSSIHSGMLSLIVMFRMVRVKCRYRYRVCLDEAQNIRNKRTSKFSF